MTARRVVGVALLVLALAGCTSTSPITLPSASAPSSTASPSPAPSASPTAAAPDCGNPVASYPPLAAVPAVSSLPASSKLAEILKRGRLIAGVSADTYLFGARDPIAGQITGFDIDVLHEISTALFGASDKIEFKAITTAQRIPSLQSGSVDIVARTMTMNCARWAQIAFSSQYYQAGQKVLVPRGSGVTGLAGLAGKRVCAPKGSTSLDKLKDFPKVVPVAADTHTDCLVQFQQGSVDAITGDDTVLAGLAAQDPYADVVGAAFTSEPYGLGIAKDDVALVRVVNGVLDRMRSDGTWQRLYTKWLVPVLADRAPTPPPAVYGRTS